MAKNPHNRRRVFLRYKRQAQAVARNEQERAKIPKFVWPDDPHRPPTKDERLNGR